MTWKIEVTRSSLGAVLTGVGLTQMDSAEWDELHSAFLEYGVLVFPRQHLRREEQAAFGRRFGELDPLVAETGFVEISNVRPDGSLRDRSDAIGQILIGNEGWHTDSSYMPVAARASVLSAEVVTKEGGETEWADMRAAYSALDESMQQRIDELSAYHSLKYSQARSGFSNQPGSYRYGLEEGDSPLRPLVKTHPETGRPSLFIGRHAYGIPGLDEKESERLLDELLAFACQPPRIWKHTWAPGDVAIWDNRCVLHRARPYNPDEVRVMVHTRVGGDPMTEAGLEVRA